MREGTAYDILKEIHAAACGSGQRSRGRRPNARLKGRRLNRRPLLNWWLCKPRRLIIVDLLDVNSLREYRAHSTYRLRFRNASEG